jgi:hypothetical protein
MPGPMRYEEFLEMEEISCFELVSFLGILAILDSISNCRTTGVWAYGKKASRAVSTT